MGVAILYSVVTMVRTRVELVDPLGRHGRHLQTIEPRLSIYCVFAMFNKTEIPPHIKYGL
jgi:hypothetical protein